MGTKHPMFPDFDCNLRIARVRGNLTLEEPFDLPGVGGVLSVLGRVSASSLLYHSQEDPVPNGGVGSNAAGGAGTNLLNLDGRLLEAVDTERATSALGNPQL